jgi:FRG domain
VTGVGYFWKPWESEISGFAAINDLITKLSKKWGKAQRQFAWRGVVNASWPLHSSLYRRLWWKYQEERRTTPPDEDAVYEAEATILADVHRWGLHNGERGRLSILSQLASLQHFGAPTRLIDVTLNAYIGLWFAVEKDDATDGRLFAIDITSKLINELDKRNWEDVLSRPWKGLAPTEWSTVTFAWKPPPFEARIAAQNGAFLFGGVPITEPGFQFRKAPPPGSGYWTREKVHECTSLALRMHKANPKAGGVPKTGSPAYTFRIAAKAKSEIRERLEAMFGYSHKTIYPDFPGFATFGTALPSRPPKPPS